MSMVIVGLDYAIVVVITVESIPIKPILLLELYHLYLYVVSITNNKTFVYTHSLSISTHTQ